MTSAFANKSNAPAILAARLCLCLALALGGGCKDVVDYAFGVCG
jgi:hypothetical protein